MNKIEAIKPKISLQISLLAILVFLFSGCSKRLQPIIRDGENHKRKAVAVFIDGTGNKMNKKKGTANSNVYKTFSLVKEGIPRFYIDGVFNKWWKLIGMEMGVGTSKRVREAYRFLCNNYNKGDSIYLFGFSRGAAACRILSNVIYTAGIPDLKNTSFTDEQEKQIVKEIYNNYRGKSNGRYKASVKKQKVAQFALKWNSNKKNPHLTLDTSSSVNIEALGLWETVIAFGPDFTEKDFNSPNPRHLYQICNIKKAFHAMALDDNRPQLYTPILLTGKSISTNCPNVNVNDVVEEVWFSGAHSDVGGGWDTSVVISNSSLKWMFSRLKNYNLLKDTTVKTNSLSTVNSMRRWFDIAVKIKNRNVQAYYDSTSLYYNTGRFKVHNSVIERIEDGTQLPEFKISSKDPKDWFDQCPFNHCFIIENGKRKFKQSCNCNSIEVIYVY